MWPSWKPYGNPCRNGSTESQRSSVSDLLLCFQGHLATRRLDGVCEEGLLLGPVKGFMKLDRLFYRLLGFWRVLNRLYASL